MLITTGYISNVSGTLVKGAFLSDASEYQIKGKPYTEYGAELPPSTKANLDMQVHKTSSTIDIVNYFLTALRQTALATPHDAVGRAATASVVPLQLLADAAGVNEAEVVENRSGLLADGFMSSTIVSEKVMQVTMIPHDEVRVRYSDCPAGPDSFIG